MLPAITELKEKLYNILLLEAQGQDVVPEMIAKQSLDVKIPTGKTSVFMIQNQVMTKVNERVIDALRAVDALNEALPENISIETAVEISNPEFKLIEAPPEGTPVNDLIKRLCEMACDEKIPYEDLYQKVQKTYIVEALEREGTQRGAAKLLGLTPGYLNQRAHKFGVAKK